jgi:hypothetical protein
LIEHTGASDPDSPRPASQNGSDGEAVMGIAPSVTPEELSFELLENGLDFVLSGLENLADETDPRSLKYAVLHLAAGLELILKERLRRHDWRLIFERPDKADEALLQSGGFKSVRFETCVERLKTDCGIEIADGDKGKLNALRDRRNRLEHFRLSDSVVAVKAASAEVVGFLVDFIDEHLRHRDFGPADIALLTSIREQLAECQAVVQERWKAIRPQVDAYGEAVLTCPDCLQNAFVLEPEYPKCLFCRTDAGPISLATRYVSEILGVSEYDVVKDGEEWPCYVCPECEVEALVDLGASGGAVPILQYACFSCGLARKEGTMSHCGSCGQPYEDQEDWVAMCDACFRYRVNSDD